MLLDDYTVIKLWLCMLIFYVTLLFIWFNFLLFLVGVLFFFLSVLSVKSLCRPWCRLCPSLLVTEWCHCWLAGWAWDWSKTAAPIVSSKCLPLRAMEIDDWIMQCTHTENLQFQTEQSVFLPMQCAENMCKAFLVPCLQLYHFL